MAGWHHQLNEYEFEQTLGDSEGQGSLVYCSSWRRKESDLTERLNNKGITEEQHIVEMCGTRHGKDALCSLI